MHIVGLQWDSVWQNTQANIDALDTQLQSLTAESTSPIDVVVLPEVFLSGFSMQPVEFAETLDGDSVNQLKQLVQKYQLALLFGMATKQLFDERDNQQAVQQRMLHYNSALCIDKHGEIISHYRKQKLFAYANEHHSYQQGENSTVFDLNGVCCALFICYDLRFPELFRAVAKQVDMIFIVASWPESRQMHWQSLLKARAIENQCFVVGVNRTGIDGNGLHYAGGSMIINPLGEVLAEGSATDKWIEAEVDVKQTRQIRQQFPFLDDM